MAFQPLVQFLKRLTTDKGGKWKANDEETLFFVTYRYGIRSFRVDEVERVKSFMSAFPEARLYKGIPAYIDGSGEVAEDKVWVPDQESKGEEQ